MRLILKRAAFKFFAILLIALIGLIADISSLLNFDVATFVTLHLTWSAIIIVISMLLIALSTLLYEFIKEFNEQKRLINNLSNNNEVATNDEVKAKEFNTDRSISRYTNQDKIKVVEEFIESIDQIYNLLKKSYQYNNGNVAFTHEQRYTFLKQNYVSNIDIIEDDLTNYLRKISYFECGEKPLREIFDKHSLKSLFDSFRDEIADFINYDGSDNKEVIFIGCLILSTRPKTY